MADDLQILVGGDVSPLEEELQKIVPVAQDVAAQIDKAWADIGGSDSAQASLAQLSQSIDATGQAASTAVPEINQVTPAVHEAGNAAHEASSAFGDLGEKLLHLVEAFALIEGMKELATASLEAYGSIQKVEISLTALTGSAEGAAKTIEELKTLALSDALNFESLTAAAQKMTALGFSADQLHQSLRSAADAAAATGAGFDQTANAIDRIALSGMASGRILATLGLSLDDLAKAMSTTRDQVAAAFKALDQSERIEVLNAALQKFKGVAEETAAGVLGQWQNLKTEWGFVLEEMGKAITPVAQDLMNLAKSDVIPFIKGSIEEFAKLPGPMKDAAVAATAAGVAFTAMWLALGGPASLALAAGAATVLTIISTFKSLGQEVGDVAKLVTGNFADMDAAVKAHAETFQKANADATKSITEFAAAQNLALASYVAIEAAARTAEKNFQAVSAAMQAGHATLSQYTTALNAMNAAEIEANNGLQTASTVLLLVENSYKQLGVSLANAVTNLKETVAAYDAGKATWGQYVSTLEAVDKAQKDVSGGLEDMATAAQLVNVEEEQLLIDAANAQTKFNAVADAYARGAATSKQYTDALNQMDTAQRNANNGLESFKNAVLEAENAQQLLLISAVNAKTALLAQLDVYQRTGQGLVALIDLTDKWAAAQEKAANGVVDLATATAMVADAQAKAELHLGNTNTLLAVATEQLSKGAIGLGVYQKFVEDAAKAHDALTGATAKSTDASKAAVPAHNALGASMAGVAENFKVATGAILSQQDALNQVADHYRQLQINLVNANTELNAVQYAYDHNQASAGMLVGALQNLIKAQEALGGSTNTTTGAMATEINELRNLAGETAPVVTGLNNIASAATSSASTTISALNSIGNAINSVAGDAFQATQALDQFFNNLGTAAGATGSATINAKPGDVIGATLNGITSYVTVGSQADLIALHDQAMQRLNDHLKAIQAQTAATVSNTTAVTNSTAQSAADAAKIAAGNAAVAAAASAIATSTDTVAAVVNTAGTAITTAASTLNDAVKSAAQTVVLGSQLLAPLLEAVYAPGTFSATPLSLGTLPNANTSTSQDGPAGAKTLTGLAQTGSVVMNINVTGNTVTSQSQAQALANTIMSTAVSRLRTVAGLKINT